MDAVAGHAQLSQEAVQDRGGIGGRPLGIVAAQVHRELHVRILSLAQQQVCGTGGEQRLADTRHALDHDGLRGGQDQIQLRGTAGEVGDVVRQRAAHPHDLGLGRDPGDHLVRQPPFGRSRVVLTQQHTCDVHH
ncbi:hypothetical protein GCM10027200_22470 [Lentzea nigeriaca]